MKSLVIIIGAFLTCSPLNGQTQSELVVSEDLIFGRDELPQNGESISGELMFFDKSKGAFRAGGLRPSPKDYWSADSVGLFSFAVGADTKASGTYSVAMGFISFAQGLNSVALGAGTYASGSYSTAMGNGTNANGSYSTALGVGTTANGIYSTSMGVGTTADGSYSTAMGGGTNANGSYSTAIGDLTYANGYASTVLGMFNDSIIGRESSATSLTPLFIIGNGNSGISRSNAMVVRKDGKVGIGENVPEAMVHIGGGGESSLLLEYQGDIFWEKSNGDNTPVLTLDAGDNIFFDSPADFVFRNRPTLNSISERMRLSADGNLNIVGALSKGSGTFKIDHPLDPLNKYLYHSFVESPDMMNVYNGNVILDANGEAVVEMADWFSALNMEYRYQLTCIGGFAQVYIAEEISDNHFKIAGGSPGLKVSWQVTGIRKDPYAQINRVQVEEMKPQAERGSYLHPTAYKINDLTVSTDNDVEND